MHPFKIKTGEWTELESLLENRGDVAALSISESRIKNGSQEILDPKELYVGPIDEIEGEFVLTPPETAEKLYNAQNIDRNVKIKEEDRNAADFYTGSLLGSPVEIKYDSELPDSEPYHSHNVFEAYTPIDGSIELSLVQSLTQADHPLKESQDRNRIKEDTIETLESGQTLVVPPFVSHKIISTKGNPDLVVERYAESESSSIAKFDLNGNSCYDWVDVGEEEYEFQPYDPEDIVFQDPREIV